MYNSPLPGPNPARPPRQQPSTAHVLVTIILAGVMLVLGALFGFAIKERAATGEYRALQDQYEALEAEAAELEANISALSADNTGLQTQVTDLEAEVAVLDEREADLVARETAATTQEGELASREEAVAAREAAVTATEQAIEENTFGNGVYTVGTDIAAGTYRVTDAVTGTCYWGIYATGTNQDDIIQNDIVSGGFPQVTVREGQDFESNRCGTWTLQQ